MDRDHRRVRARRPRGAPVVRHRQPRLPRCRRVDHRTHRALARARRHPHVLLRPVVRRHRRRAATRAHPGRLRREPVGRVLHVPRARRRGGGAGVAGRHPLPLRRRRGVRSTGRVGVAGRVRLLQHPRPDLLRVGPGARAGHAAVHAARGGGPHPVRRLGVGRLLPRARLVAVAEHPLLLRAHARLVGARQALRPRVPARAGGTACRVARRVAVDRVRPRPPLARVPAHQWRPRQLRRPPALLR